MTCTPCTLRSTAGALSLGMIALAITATTASGASTRSEYVAQVDPICQNTHVQEKAAAHSFKARAHQLIKRGVDPESKPGIRAAVHFYGRIARAERRAIGDIASVAPAPGDEEIISEWLGKRMKVVARLQHLIRVLPQGEEHKARRAISRAFKADFEADNLVQDFGFRYCAGS